MRVKYLMFIFVFFMILPQAHAQDLGDILKQLTTGNTDDKKPATADDSKNKPALNQSTPSTEEEINIGREITGNRRGAA
ncbi:MAG: hypothetical protein EHM45_23740, partial [Desulfobacteraceae bacterium]